MQLIKKYKLFIAVFILIVAIFLIVYSPTLFNFFLADDLGYLAWANNVVNCPKLLIEKYIGSWQGWMKIEPPPANTLVVYRPLYNTVVFLEYKLWGLNGLYFRLVNMTIEILSGLVLGLIIFALGKKLIDQESSSNQQFKTWSLLTAALFVFFPLHCESVNWMTDIVDPLVTLFSLLSLWCYIQWRTLSKLTFFWVSITSTILAFLTKEMAVVLPLMIFIYELLIAEKLPGDSRTKNIRNTLLRNLFRSIMYTWPYGLILVAYFGLRKILLGDFIAGYPDDMCYPTIAGWLRGLGDIFVPINTNIIGRHDYIYRAWLVVLLIAISLSTITTLRAKKDVQKIICFFILWFLLSLLPTYKVFPTLMSCGTGSRLAYLSSAPFCALLTYGLAVLSSGKRFSPLICSIDLIFLGLAALIVYTNNIAWAKAGHWTNKVVNEFRNYYKTINDDPFVYITGLPTEFVKSIYSVGILAAVTRVPILDKERLHCWRLDSEEQYIKPGFLKTAVVNNPSQIKLLNWDTQSQTLKPVTDFQQKYKFKKEWQGSELKKIMHVTCLHGLSKPDVNCLDDGIIEIISNEKENTFIMIEINLPKLPCWYIDFLGLKIQFVDLKTFGPFGQADLLFTNDIAKSYSKDYRAFYNCKAAIKSSDKEQEILFQLRDIPAWSMGGKCSSIRIILPIEHTVKINKLYIPEIKTLMPSIELQSLVNTPPGQICLDKHQSIQTIKYNGLSLKNCKEALLEILPASNQFKLTDPTKDNKTFFLTKRTSGSTGQFIISKDDFYSETGLYRAHIRLLDKTGNQIGFPSDTFFISVTL